MSGLEWIILTAICLGSGTLGALILRRGAAVRTVHGVTAGTAADLATATADALSAETLDNAPISIWTQDSQNRVEWSNAAYRALVAAHEEERRCDLGPLFSLPSDRSGRDQSMRTALYSRDTGRPEWYDVTWVQSGETTYCYAQNVTALVNIEDSKKDFFQTMAGTFAQLSTGLAIFDQDQRLYLFNPALVDLCGLPFSFLSTQPTMAAFFDRLRDTQSMPEPRDYSSWRQDMAELARAAAEGRYQETWTLPSGSVYQVTGRPHPGGAVAFLFEDISAEVSLARQFRAELDLCQSVLDTVDDAICVFSGSGRLMFVNAAYRKLWQVSPDRVLRGQGLEEAWQEWAGPGDDLTGVGLIGAAAAQPVQLTGGKGKGLVCSTRSLPGGDVMVTFKRHIAAEPEPAKTPEPV